MNSTKTWNRDAILLQLRRMCGLYDVPITTPRDLHWELTESIVSIYVGVSSDDAVGKTIAALSSQTTTDKMSDQVFQALLSLRSPLVSACRYIAIGIVTLGIVLGVIGYTLVFGHFTRMSMLVFLVVCVIWWWLIMSIKARYLKGLDTSQITKLLGCGLIVP